MKFVIQRVSEAACRIDGKVSGEISRGFLVLIGISNEDTKEIADKMIKKLINMRIFDDENGKTNLDLASVGGELLLISQFTLYADCKRGNRTRNGLCKEADNIGYVKFQAVQDVSTVVFLSSMPLRTQDSIKHLLLHSVLCFHSKEVTNPHRCHT